MKKTTALALFTVFDLFALAIFYFFAGQPYVELSSALAHGAEHIRVSANFYVGFGVVVIPAIHVIGFFETCLPRYFNIKLCAAVVLTTLVVSLSFGAGMTKLVRREILGSGYVHCENALTRMDTVVHSRYYTRNVDICRQLTCDEKRSRLYGWLAPLNGD